jgi:hypothetical protein
MAQFDSSEAVGERAPEAEVGALVTRAPTQRPEPASGGSTPMAAVHPTLRFNGGVWNGAFAPLSLRSSVRS